MTRFAWPRNARPSSLLVWRSPSRTVFASTPVWITAPTANSSTTTAPRSAMGDRGKLMDRVSLTARVVPYRPTRLGHPQRVLGGVTRGRGSGQTGDIPSTERRQPAVLDHRLLFALEVVRAEHACQVWAFHLDLKVERLG